MSSNLIYPPRRPDWGIFRRKLANNSLNAGNHSGSSRRHEASLDSCLPFLYGLPGDAGAVDVCWTAAVHNFKAMYGVIHSLFVASKLLSINISKA